MALDPEDLTAARTHLREALAAIEDLYGDRVAGLARAALGVLQKHRRLVRPNLVSEVAQAATLGDFTRFEASLAIEELVQRAVLHSEHHPIPKISLNPAVTAVLGEGA